MPRVVWTPASLADVSRLHKFLRTKNRNAADRAISTIRQSVRRLTEHPEAGRPVEGLAAEFREWPIAFGSGGYVVLYRFDSPSLFILAIRHSREAGY